MECQDEESCNGYRYGLRCNSEKRSVYVPSWNMCDGYEHCVNGADEDNCQLTHVSMTTGNQGNHYNNVPMVTCRLISGDVIPLFNFTRCGPRFGYSFKLSSEKITINFCEDFLDQTNCSDYSRVGLHCPVLGYLTTVANQIVCVDMRYSSNSIPIIPRICDDGLDKACVFASLSCLVHKQQLCDGQIDCQDRSDETHDICGKMLERQCVRRYVFQRSRQNINFPLAWVQDGISDCWNGEDEVDSWPTCGLGPNIRARAKLSDPCSEVFLCYGTDHFIEFTDLCDKIDSCEKENNICELSRSQAVVFPIALRDNQGRATLTYCSRGLQDIRNLNKNSCKEVEFVLSERHVFGKNSSQQIKFPSSHLDCRHYHGESYVFLSCLGHCTDTNTCPLRTGRLLTFNSCPGQYRRRRVFSIDTDHVLTFLIKDPRTGLLGDDVFVCANNRTCLTYDKVCNLADDCGDGSDEEGCNNHFRCDTSGEYLPITQKCDQVIHCVDKSDECNESCGQSIINGFKLKMFAWLIGILAVLLNCNALIRNSATMTDGRSEAAFFNSSMIILISFGDLLVGIYLIILAIFDSYHGSGHCEIQLDWITSNVCIALGVISTFGSHTSLFSMTALSVIRASGVQSRAITPRKVTKRSFRDAGLIILGIVLLSSFVSWLPLIETFEDFFVNGIKYDDSNTLFVGCPNKKTHMAVLQEYYGRMQVSDDLRWQLVRDLARAMFSSDYGGITGRTLTFYGNDPVCLFKYFVRMDDPQRNFSISILAINLSCFVIIAACYGTIAASSKNSVSALTKEGLNATLRQTNDRLQRVVHAIIISDFLCWMPFIAVCWVHLFAVLDARPWYPIFSIIVLPLNSVINPILYDKLITSALHSVLEKCKSKLSHRCYVIRNAFAENNSFGQEGKRDDQKVGTSPGLKDVPKVGNSQQNDIQLESF